MYPTFRRDKDAITSNAKLLDDGVVDTLASVDATHAEGWRASLFAGWVHQTTSDAVHNSVCHQQQIHRVTADAESISRRRSGRTAKVEEREPDGTQHSASMK
jgi:hypothetical protein